jgi:hypothetical protein
MIILKRILAHIKNRIFSNTFIGSEKYWEKRYISGGNSGEGSYGKLAEFKAEIINCFIFENKITSIMELGCGDGNQLKLANYPFYTGFDISPTAIEICKQKFKLDTSKNFYLISEIRKFNAELTLSLDVIYHLIEDDVFDKYMSDLFDSSKKFVIIYSTNKNKKEFSLHVRHRHFSQWISENRRNWSLKYKIKNKHAKRFILSSGSPADFYIYEKND